MTSYNFPDISLLVTHYNRPESLENLLSTFRKMGCTFGEIIVSDDCSKPIYQQQLKNMSLAYDFQLVGGETNQGLGNNINKGQAIVTKPFTLYIQEDFEPSNLFPEKLYNGLKCMLNNPALDIVKYYAYYPYPYLKPYNQDFDEMYIPTLALDYDKIYFYTDHPHLRRSTFAEKFGKYPVGLKGDTTEYKMCISFIQNKGKGLFYKDYQNLILQKNSAEEPSTMTRTNWKQRPNVFVKVIRDTYRQLKYNYDILTMKPLS
ncbi:glycosyltransferase [Pedobacter frigidisoli]|uniref:Glycosyltransferase n=1 Tax=Pedobacter frigidisoli TaxID=2530455 RepID=A0A4V2MLG5_9SPHI|nr:glycosyltransferase [Pedobacter frigidisoli]TCD01997.1 glycosyltransferase [Pedobacter frigidisoli]